MQCLKNRNSAEKTIDKHNIKFLNSDSIHDNPSIAFRQVSLPTESLYFWIKILLSLQVSLIGHGV